MSAGRRLLLETLVGHFAWLEATHPRKAATKKARRAKKAVEACLRTGHSPRRPVL